MICDVFTMAGEVPEFDPNPNPSDLDPGRLDASNPRGIPDSASTSIDGRRDPLANRVRMQLVYGI